MKHFSLNYQRSFKKGFTLVEVLAAMLFMMILIPTIIHGLTVSNRLGVAADRKKVAARIADNLLTEKIVTGEWQLNGQQRGDVVVDSLSYQWAMSTENWTNDSMLLVKMQVGYKVQGKDFGVELSTLVNAEAQTE